MTEPTPGQAPAASRATLVPLMLAAFTSTVGIMAFVAVAGPLAHVLSLEPWHLGVAMAIAGVAWMVMARVWGVRSDRAGRRPVLLLGLAGFCLSYLALALFIEAARHFALPAEAAFAGIAIGRAAMGTFYAAVPVVAGAVVADTVRPEGRAKSMAAIGAASSAGLVVGPGFAGLLAGWSLQLPLYVTAALPLFALALLWVALPAETPGDARPRPAPRLSDPRLRPAMVFGFLAAFAVAIAQVVVGFFAIDRLGLDPAAAAAAAGTALAVVGLALVTTQTLMQKLDWSPLRLVATGAALAAAGFAATAAATTPFMLWAAYGFAAAGMGMVYPAVPALAANSVDPGEQGAAAGSVAMAQGLGIVAGPLAGTALYALFPAAPYLASALALGGGALAALRLALRRA